MSSTGLPARIDELLATRVNSFEKLELLVALHAAPRATVTVESLCSTLKFTRETVRQAAMDLRAASLVELTEEGEVRLFLVSASDEQIVMELVRIYNEDRFTVVRALGQISLGKLRNMASRAFADAFVIRAKKDRDDG